MSILQLGPVIFSETDKLIQYCLLSSQKMCHACGTAMQLSPRSDVFDGVRFHCPACHKCTSIRDSSFFSKSRMQSGWS